MRFLRHSGGSAAIELALTAPAFFAMIIGIITMAMGLYAKVALQHSVEMAARCASINSTTCGSNSAIQSYAVAQSYGLQPASSVFAVTNAACGKQVSASYPVTLNFGPIGEKTVTLTAQSCFPT